MQELIRSEYEQAIHSVLRNAKSGCSIAKSVRGYFGKLRTGDGEHVSEDGIG